MVGVNSRIASAEISETGSTLGSTDQHIKNFGLIARGLSIVRHLVRLQGTGVVFIGRGPVKLLKVVETNHP